MSARRSQSLTTILFDIRVIIGALMGIYGIILLIAGLAPAVAKAGADHGPGTAQPAELAVGSEGNLWVAAALLLTAIAFTAWTLLDPAKDDQGDGVDSNESAGGKDAPPAL